MTRIVKCPEHDYNSCCTKNKHREKANVVSTAINDDSSSNSECTFMVTSTSHSPHNGSEQNTWYINTRASQHFMCNHEFLHNFITTNRVSVMLGNNSSIKILSHGNMHGRIKVNGSPH